MDLLTQGLLGSNLALAGSPSTERLRQTALVGLLAGFAADVDFLISSSSDPLLNLEFHRHFTHSLLFVPLGGLIVSVLLYPFFRRSFSGLRLWLIATLGYALSGLLDAATSYGTSLLWPISDTRFSFNIISIIDPVFTLLLLSGVLLASWKRRRVFSLLFVGLAAGYLMLGWLQNARVQALSQQLAEQRGHEAAELLVRPTLGNLWLWRSVYRHDDRYFVDALRMNPFTRQSNIFMGQSIAVFDAGAELSELHSDSVLMKDIQRFGRFTNGYLARDPAQPQLISDVRYANLPNAVSPLWAIRIDRAKPDQHARYELFRDASPATRQRFVAMLFNRNADHAPD